MDRKDVFTKERAGSWHFDGQGISCSDELSSEEQAAAMKALVAFANQAHRYDLQVYHKQEFVPTIHLELTTDELKDQGDAGFNPINIEITRPDGTKGRLHLRLTPYGGGAGNKAQASIATYGREQGNETKKSLTVKFVDWENPIG